jgi:hypothetical protein
MPLNERRNPSAKVAIESRGSLLDDVHQAGDGAAGELAAHHLDAHLDPRAGRAESLHCLTLQEVHTHVRRDRVEPATRHDARAGLSGRRLVASQHAADPLHLATEVAVVGPGFSAGLDQPLAMECVLADRRHDDARRRAELVAAQGLVHEARRTEGDYVMGRSAHGRTIRHHSAGPAPHAALRREPLRTDSAEPNSHPLGSKLKSQSGPTPL